MIENKILKEALTFDDVLLVPQYSEVVPADVDISTRITKNIILRLPIISAAMDTVTEYRMAIAMALEGGLGIIHKNLSPEEQARQVERVKSFPVDFTKFPHAVTGNNGGLLAGAAVGAADLDERLPLLVQADVDVVTVDSAHGHSRGILDAVKKIKDKYPDLDVMAGNIVTAKAALDLVSAGADAVKIGVGPGAICTTRVVAGVGVPQITALLEVFDALKDTDKGIIADGGIKYSGDITKAIAAGAHAVMVGRLLAGTDETPGEVTEMDGKKFKQYVGMGSLAAMKRGSKDRYFQHGKQAEKLVPEGIEALVDYKGPVKKMLYQLAGGLRAGMGYCGTASIDSLRRNGKFVKISASGLKESHPHDVMIAKRAPNYDK